MAAKERVDKTSERTVDIKLSERIRSNRKNQTLTGKVEYVSGWNGSTIQGIEEPYAVLSLRSEKTKVRIIGSDSTMLMVDDIVSVEVGNPTNEARGMWNATMEAIPTILSRVNEPEGVENTAVLEDNEDVVADENTVVENNTTDEARVSLSQAFLKAKSKNYFELRDKLESNVYVLDSVEWKARTEEELTLSIKQLLQHRHEEQTYTTEKKRVQELRQRRVYILLHVEALRRLRVSEENNVDDNVDNEATVVIATAITKARWGSLTITVEDIATECDTTTDNVNNVIASETYLNVIRETFNKRKGWRTWAKKGASIVAKRLWITEEQATTIIEGINK